MAKVQKYLVVGTPISHSLSPKLHNATYRKLGLNRELEAVDPQNRAGFDTLITDLRAGMYEGFCVTIPWKLAAYESCDQLSSTAKGTGAVNYLRREADGTLTGDNTDAMGFAQACKLKLNFGFKGSIIAVCGSGGASRAIIAACLTEGAAKVDLVTRNPATVNFDPATSSSVVTPSPVEEPYRSQQNVSLGDLNPATSGVISYDDLYASDTTYDLLVNATPLGMNDERTPVSADFLTSKVKAVYDAVYRREGTTPLVTSARVANIPAADGRSMLIEQAVLGMQFWNIDEGEETLRSIIDTSLTA